jgi:EAL domain-containing protein (putative c-di-GMP-specific phosphodiesterase class I)
MIETEQHARLMHEMGVDLGQGWFYGQGGALPIAGHASPS